MRAMGEQRGPEVKGMKVTWKKSWKKNWQLYILLVIPVAYIILFKFVPLYGLQIALKKFTARDGILGSEWLDPLFGNFIKFFKDYNFWKVIYNTLILSIYGLIAGFPLPIILALSLHYTKNKGIKKTVQMVTYAPHFISTVVIVGLLNQFFQTRGGLVNQILIGFGGSEYDFFGNAGTFRHMYVWSGIWQGMGFSSIVYISALSGVPESLHEAAVVDGANKLKRIFHIDLPEIMPTAIILLILNTGKILNVGFEKVLLMQNPVNTQVSQVISTYVYSLSFTSSIPQFSYSTAIGLFQSLIGIILLLTVNRIANKVSNSGLF